MNNEPTKSKIGILTVSDRASRGEYEDRGGPAIREYLQEVLSSPWEAVYRVVPDEQQDVERNLIELCEEENCSLVITTGGTGPLETRHHHRSDRGSLRETPSRFWRVDAKGLAGESRDRDSFPSDRRDLSEFSDRQSARPTQGDLRMSRCRFSCDPVLHRPHRRAIPHHK